MKIEVLEGKLPCAEYMEIVGKEKCNGCVYNSKPNDTDINPKDAMGNSEPFCISCDSPRSTLDADAYKTIYEPFYGLTAKSEESEELKEKPAAEFRIDPAIAADAENPPGIHPTCRNQPD